MQKNTVVVCDDKSPSAPRIISKEAYDPNVHTLWVETPPPPPVITPEPVPAEPRRWFRSEESE